MMNNNKILTVSYGTFSCTLEGFDDSFGTMKAIAEYFRDLAADDRYFGAEPPQPDAQMLAHIAQKEISRRVEAREHEGKIVLSARQEQATPQPAMQMPPALAAGIGGLAGIAAAPAQNAVQTTAPAAKPAETEIVPSLPDDEVEAFFAESPSHEPAEDGTDLDFATGTITAPTSSIADKLQRIRAVVSRQTDVADEPDYIEDEHATTDAVATADEDIDAPSLLPEDDGADSAAQDELLADTLRDIEGALQADDDAETGHELHDVAALEEDEYEDLDAEEEIRAEDEDDLERLFGRIRLDENHEEAISDAAAFDDEMEGDDAPELASSEDDAEAVADDYDTDDEEAATSVLTLVDALSSDDRDEDNLFDEDAADDAEDEAAVAAAPRARVLKVKRVELEAAIARGKLVEYDDEDDMDEDAETDDESGSSLSAEDEAELARELAELESELADGDADEHEFAADEPARSARRSLPDIDEEQDADISRLMQETESQMGEPESATRRDAFAHLRAAVAAKKADDASGSSTADDTDEDEAYRADLADVVRPRRPESAGTTRTARPESNRPAPLKLVAEQRIDTPTPRPEGPVRPRRVAAVSDTSPIDEDDSFADFAAEMGATKLPELLEAAAAYLSFVEGREQFSRPQLMTKVRQVEKETFSREDGLRSFGKLLRDGKIEKIRGGRFQASEQIGFKPDARAAS